MRKSTRGLITACAGLAAGAAFGAAPAAADPGWWPPGYELGYYNTMSDCNGYANSMFLMNADYDCDFYSQRVVTPYVLVIQRPVRIVQQPVVDYEPAPVAQQPVMDQPAPVAEEPAPVAEEPAPVAEEPTGGALVSSEKPAKAHKKHKKHKGGNGDEGDGQGQAQAQGHAQDTGYAQNDQAQAMNDEPGNGGPACDCNNAGVLAVPAAPVQVVPVGGPVVVSGGYYQSYGGWHHPWH
ncbi:hypothetical protein Aph02nite_16100 [Actinoplanes philippinensis]|uniref:Secreted protein n=1 Tax=Actinoplanes philippinensis TaxID=35752 RepID=A0A1I2B599_9ACTN|nr:hypothetical protein [Actinoplanes philippinensis]GIE75660.1 hypothetical protein Aph02nite_16100 [Actinoplanes philippinensis]SFE50340.1 hypothetical protein SAMN05421541_10275 [Actinoplanes philippinensis]